MANDLLPETSADLPQWKSMSEAPDEWMFLNSEAAMKEIDAATLRWYNFLAAEYFSKEDSAEGQCK